MNSKYKTPEPLVNVREVLWDLASQWKAVLIAALLIMLLLSGLKYYKDINAYNNAINEQPSEADVSVPADQRILEIMEALPESDRSTVEFLVKQNEWIETEKNYLNNSILMNTNPANQRTLLIDYLISAESGSEDIATALFNGYASQILDETVVEGVKQALGLNCENKYITELISYYNYSKNVNGTDNDTVFEVCVVLPDDADVSAVKDVITKTLNDYSNVLKAKIGPHSISLLRSGESYLYNINAVNNRNNMMYSIYNLTNNTKNMKSTLSDAQKVAVDSIIAIKKEAANASSAAAAAESAVQEPPKPGFSKKYALVGFVFGVFAYSLVYLLLVIMKGCVNNASEVEYYTHNRLLGEIYDNSKRSGLAKLLHSSFVDNIRYRGKTDAAAQVNKAVDAVDAACEHAQTKKLTLFDMTGGAGAQTGDIINGIRGRGIDVNIVDAANGVEDKNLLDVEDSVLLIGPETKIPLLSGLMSLCADYDVRSLGSIYTA